MARKQKNSPTGFVKFDPETGQRDVEGYSKEPDEMDGDD